MSTMPFAVDDPAAETSKQYNLSEALVDLYNGGRRANSHKGVTNALLIPFFSMKRGMYVE